MEAEKGTGLFRQRNHIVPNPTSQMLRCKLAPVALHGRQHQGLYDGADGTATQDQLRKVGSGHVLQLNGLAKDPQVGNQENEKWDDPRGDFHNTTWSKCEMLFALSNILFKRLAWSENQQ